MPRKKRKTRCRVPKFVKEGGVHMLTAKAENDFGFVVHAKLGEIGVSGKYTKELRIVEWGKYEPKFDIRPWRTGDSDGSSDMGKGITFTKEEMIMLKQILDSIDIDGYVMPDKKRPVEK